nr:MAG TPA: hypothetical protein [Caudoviricetes sp.]
MDIIGANPITINITISINLSILLLRLLWLKR